MLDRRFLSCAAGALALLHFTGDAAAHDRDPADPNAQVPQVRYRSVLSGYVYTPVPGVPGNWRDLNDRAERIGGPGGQLREPDEPIRKKKR